jgi:uncharacterized protein YacL
MLTIEIAVVLALVIGAFGGFVNSIAKWLESDEQFNSKKNVKAILTGIFAGLALGVAAIGALTADMPFQTLVVTLVMIFLSAVGVDQLTSRVSGMINGTGKTTAIVKPTV